MGNEIGELRLLAKSKWMNLKYTAEIFCIFSSTHQIKWKSLQLPVRETAFRILSITHVTPLLQEAPPAKSHRINVMDQFAFF